MLIVNRDTFKAADSLRSIIDSLDVYPEDMSFGADIDEVHRKFFVEGMNEQSCHDEFLKWASRSQPCLFGRLGSKQNKGVNFDMCWITSTDIDAGDMYVCEKIQHTRRAWKDRATNGLSSGFLILFQDQRLARAKPGHRLLETCRRASELYIIENAPLQHDTIYTEAIPILRDKDYGLFKAGINVFYPGAHRTLNHDRRIPGGLLISVNSPGHLAHSLVMRGVMTSLTEAVQWIYDIAMKSVGNGGIGGDGTISNSWHNTTDDPAALAVRCPVRHRPHYIPENYSGRTYSATYHTDVLLPTDVTVKKELDPEVTEHEMWPWLVIDYISENQAAVDHINYGLFHPHPVLPEARYHNPWPPRIAHNSPLFEY